MWCGFEVELQGLARCAVCKIHQGGYRCSDCGTMTHFVPAQRVVVRKALRNSEPIPGKKYHMSCKMKYLDFFDSSY